MLVTVVFAVLEPFSLTLDSSIAWRIASTLRSGNALTLQDQEGVLGPLHGVVPILQPILADIENKRAVLRYMKAIVGLNAGVRVTRLTSAAALAVLSSDGSLSAGLDVCRGIPVYALPFLLVSPELAPVMTAPDRTALHETISQAVGAFWPSEPINYTTAALHLTTEGQLMSGAEIRSEGLRKAQLLVSSGVVNTTPQTVPLVTFAFQPWKGAGMINTFAAEADTCGPPDSCDTCDTCSTCDSCDSCGGCGS